MKAETNSPGAFLTIVRWERHRWMRAAPGRIALGLLLIYPGAVFLPFEKAGVFSGWLEGSSVLLAIGILVLAGQTGKDAARPSPEDIWLFQKGLSLPDWAITRWVIDTLLSFLILLWWVIVLVAASYFRGEPLSLLGAASVLVWLTLMFSLCAGILFVVGAAGSDRGVDFMLLVVLLGFTEPLITRWLPGALAPIADLLLPPFLETVRLRSVIALGESIRIALPPAFEIAAYLTALLAIGAALLSRRRPQPR